MAKPSLSFYTNLPTPYQLDFFSALKNYFDLRVIYFSNQELNREWKLSGMESGYQVTTLHDNWLARLVQKKVSSFHFSFEIIKQLREDKSQFVIINGTYWTPNVLLALFIGKLRRKDLFYWNEPLFPVKNKLIYYLQYLLLLPVRVCTTAVLAIGLSGVDCYKYYGYKKTIYNIPYNIDITLFHKSNLDASVLNNLKSLYKSNNEVVFLSSGSLIFRKGMDTVIRAFSMISPELNARLLILGNGPDRKFLEELSDTGSDRIHFLGLKDKKDVPYYFALSDIFVFASRYDGWALVINEAAAADLPIISSNRVGAASDKIRNGFNGFICDAEDVDAFYGYMKMLILDYDKRIEIVRNMKEMKEKLSSEYNAKLIYGICKLH